MMADETEVDSADLLEAMVNELNDSLSQESNSPDILHDGIGRHPQLNAANFSQAPMTSRSMPACTAPMMSSISATTPVFPSRQPGAAVSSAPGLPGTGHAAATAATAAAAFAPASSQPMTVSTSALVPSPGSTIPHLDIQSLPVQMMTINGREQAAVLMTTTQAQVWQCEQLLRAAQISRGGQSALAEQMAQQQRHMQQLLASAKLDTVFAIPMTAALAGQPLAPSTVAGSVPTTMASVNAERPAAMSAAAPTVATGTPAMSNAVAPSAAPTSSFAGTSAAPAAAVPSVSVSSSQIASAIAPTTAAAAAAAQANAAAAAAAQTLPGRKQLPIDNLSEPARKRKKKAAVDALPTPLSPYQCFFREIQVEIRKQNPKASFLDLTKTVNTMWESMPEGNRAAYNTQAQQSVLEYDQAVKAIQGSSPVASNGAAVAQFYAAETDGKAGVRNRSKKASKCLNEECMNMPVTMAHRGALYCSDVCVFTHCTIAFKNAVAERRKAIP